jgi:hypothetical protein
MPDTTVLIDAQNARRSQWPNIPEQEFARRSCAWARAEGVRAVIVFDGRAPQEQLGDDCAVVGTGAESADEWLIREAARLRDAGKQFWLVTSDRALRDAAAPGAERVIGGGAFARQLPPAG